MCNRKIRNWEIAGVVFITLTGSLLHFVFAWSGSWHPLAWLAAVNESTWEHLKLAFWPGLLWALVMRAVLPKGAANNFWTGKILGLLAMPLVITGLFYGYQAVLGRDYLFLDISIFVLAVLCGEWTAYRLLIARPLGAAVRRTTAAVLVLLVTAFALLTYHPPRSFLFRDPVHGGYGITARVD